MFRKSVFLSIVLTLILGLSACGPATVSFPDPSLEAAIREFIDKPEGPILPSDLEGVTSLDASGRDITDLTGVEHFSNLAALDLSLNQIRDISPLSSLANLTELYLGFNQISDISALYCLTNLSLLDLSANKISDTSALSNLANLAVLELSHNEISNISALSNLTNLAVLFLSTNQISDISPLVENSGLSSGHFVYLTDNPLSTRSLDVYIPQLEERGVDVSW